MLGDIVACKIKELNGVKTILISAYDLDEKMVRDLIERRCIVSALKKPIRLQQPMIEKIEQVMKENIYSLNLNSSFVFLFLSVSKPYQLSLNQIRLALLC